MTMQQADKLKPGTKVMYEDRIVEFREHHQGAAVILLYEPTRGSEYGIVRIEELELSSFVLSVCEDGALFIKTNHGSLGIEKSEFPLFLDMFKRWDAGELQLTEAF